MAAAKQVDLDLDVAQPDPKTFRFRGKVYNLPAEVPIPTINAAVKLEQHYTAAEEAARDAAAQGEDDAEQLVEALTLFYDFTMGVIRDHNENVDDLPFTYNDVMLIFGVLVGRPGLRLDEAIAEQLRVAGAEVDDDGQVTSLPPTPPNRETRRKAKQAGSPSRKRSPARSSA